MKEKKETKQLFFQTFKILIRQFLQNKKKLFFFGGGTLPLKFNIPEDVNNKEVYIVGLILYQIYLIQ